MPLIQPSETTVLLEEELRAYIDSFGASKLGAFIESIGLERWKLAGTDLGYGFGDYNTVSIDQPGNLQNDYGYDYPAEILQEHPADLDPRVAVPSNDDTYPVFATGLAPNWIAPNLRYRPTIGGRRVAVFIVEGVVPLCSPSVTRADIFANVRQWDTVTQPRDQWGQPIYNRFEGPDIHYIQLGTSPWDAQGRGASEVAGVVVLNKTREPIGKLEVPAGIYRINRLVMVYHDIVILNPGITAGYLEYYCRGGFNWYHYPRPEPPPNNNPRNPQWWQPLRKVPEGQPLFTDNPRPPYEPVTHPGRDFHQWVRITWAGEFGVPSFPPRDPVDNPDLIFRVHDFVEPVRVG